MAQRKTTLMLDEQILAAYKANAAQAGRSLSSLVEEAMRVFDRKEEVRERPQRWTLPVGSPGAYIGKADPSSNAEMLAASEKPYGNHEGLITVDVCVLVDANRPASTNHVHAKEWLETALVADEAFGIWDVTLVSAYRLLTDARIFAEPETPETALAYLKSVRDAPATVRLEPGPRFWTIFDRLCREADFRGPLSSDAMLAALAIEHGCRIATFDKDFAKFRAYRPFGR